MYSVRQFSAFYSHFQVTSGQMTSLRGHFGHLRSRDVISRHVTASYLRATALYEVKCTVYASFRPATAISK